MVINEFTQERANFWSHSNGRNYRLFGAGITPNGCWRLHPCFREIVDYDVATGETIYGEPIELEYSTVPACYPVKARSLFD